MLYEIWSLGQEPYRLMANSQVSVLLCIYSVHVPTADVELYGTSCGRSSLSLYCSKFRRLSILHDYDTILLDYGTTIAQ